MTSSSAEVMPALGESECYLQALDRASKLAVLDRPVLIWGERGSGKELVAQRMHYLSPRWDQPFIKLNCAALTESLVESALFGHEVGAFTGAQRAHAGYFERGGSGTLFLDEVATLSMRVQEKLLRVLEYGEFERLGGNKVLRSEVRVLVATHADLKSEVVAGRFRADLLDRMVFDVVTVPPLRVRGDDVLLLAQHFAVKFVAELGWDFFPGFSGRANKALLAYPWPGNVRELKSAVERSLFRWGDGGEPVDELVLDPYRVSWKSIEIGEELEVISVPDVESAYPCDFKRMRADWELRQLRAAMQAHGGHQGRAAAALSLSYDQFRALWRTRNKAD